MTTFLNAEETKWQVICDNIAAPRVGYLDVEVVGSQDQLKKGSLVHLRKKVSVRARLRRCQESPKFEEEKTASPEKMSSPKSFSKSYS